MKLAGCFVDVVGKSVVGVFCVIGVIFVEVVAGGKLTSIILRDI